MVVPSGDGGSPRNRSRTLLAPGLARMALAVLLAGCGATTTAGPATTTTTVAAVTTTRATVADGGSLPIGQPFRTRDGGTVSVLTYQQPLPPEVLEPDPGMEFSAVEVEVCAGPGGGRRATAEAFEVEMPDGARRRRAFFGPKEPALAEGRLEARECRRGWVNFEVPEDERPRFVVFEGSSAARWGAGGRRTPVPSK